MDELLVNVLFFTHLNTFCLIFIMNHHKIEVRPSTSLNAFITQITPAKMDEMTALYNSSIVAKNLTDDIIGWADIASPIEQMHMMYISHENDYIRANVSASAQKLADRANKNHDNAL